MTTRDTTKDGIDDDYEYYAELERECFADEYTEEAERRLDDILAILKASRKDPCAPRVF